jgi:hypothetical protein
MTGRPRPTLRVLVDRLRDQLVAQGQLLTGIERKLAIDEAVIGALIRKTGLTVADFGPEIDHPRRADPVLADDLEIVLSGFPGAPAKH